MIKQVEHFITHIEGPWAKVSTALFVEGVSVDRPI